MANDTCPHCGAGRLYERLYECGTCCPIDDLEQSDHCETRCQLATVAAERDELRRELEELRNRMQDAAMEAREER